MIRREFLKTTAMGATLGVLGSSRPPLAAAADAPCAAPAFPKVAGVTKYVSEFVVNAKYEDIPADVVAIGKKSILDTLGLCLAGTKAEATPLVRAYIDSLGCTKGNASVLGTSIKLPLRFASFTNGTQIHADDFDDTQLASEKDRVYGLLTHPSVSVLPAVLGASEAGSTSGKEFMLAYHLGVEVECKITESVYPRSYEDGFHTTGICGVFGSAAGISKMRKFTAEQTAVAFGIAASQAAGLRENFGTMTKPFQAGHASECGIVAADFSQLGWTAADDILEAGRGYFHAYGGGYSPALLMNKLGKPWTFADPGVSIKPYPSGSLTHPGMTEMSSLIKEHGIKADQVESVDVGTNHNMPNALIRHHPTTGLEAKFSMEYSMAVLLVHGKAGLGEYTDAAVNQPEVQAMIKKIHFDTDPVAEAAGYDKMTTIITIHMKDGKIIKGSADFGKGSPANPMSYDDVAEKFRLCCEYAQWPEAKAAKIVEFVRGLENAADMRSLVALCTS